MTRAERMGATLQRVSVGMVGETGQTLHALHGPLRGAAGERGGGGPPIPLWGRIPKKTRALQTAPDPCAFLAPRNFVSIFDPPAQLSE